jgi:hypothetical protein
MDFNDFYWHDAIIIDIVIDRSNPGIKDTILFDIDFPDEGKVELVFEDVYWSKMTLNFGVVAQESILNAFVTDRDDKDLINISSKWQKYVDGIKLYCYVINLNSTGGEIKIIAKEFKVLYK